MANATCIYCGEKSEFFCDFMIGYDIETTESGLLSLRTRRFTCDAPLCEKHRKQQGVIFAHGKQGFADTIDWCMCHVAEPDWGHEKSLSNINSRSRMLINESQARIIRHNHYNRVSGLHIVKPMQPDLFGVH